ncbi:histidine phosphatase family protein [Candidatus Woesearchaeota archaeon]|nr:histidine phosphatase family protein [Candidatus Woesearchaeota archaeon]
MPWLYVFRHGESKDNINQVFSGWRDSPLAAQGKKSAKLLAKKLKSRKIDLAFSSDQVRALDTLKEVLKHHKNVPVIIDARLRERDYGDITGLRKNVFQKKNPKLYEIYHRSFTKGPPKGESFKMVLARVNPFIKDLIKIMKTWNVNVAISAHGNSIRPIRKHFETLSIHEMRTIENGHDVVWSYRV